MPVNIPTLTAEQLLPVSGVTLGIAEAGIKNPGRKDVLVMLLAEGTQTAGVFAQHRWWSPNNICRCPLSAHW